MRKVEAGLLAVLTVFAVSCAELDPADSLQQEEQQGDQEEGQELLAESSQLDEPAVCDLTQGDGSECLKQADKDVETLAYCPVEIIEPCIANYAICAVRCCDDVLIRSWKYCGQCTNFAYEACYWHNGPKRIRWTFY